MPNQPVPIKVTVEPHPGNHAWQAVAVINGIRLRTAVMHPDRAAAAAAARVLAVALGVEVTP